MPPYLLFVGMLAVISSPHRLPVVLVLAVVAVGNLVLVRWREARARPRQRNVSDPDRLA